MTTRALKQTIAVLALVLLASLGAWGLNATLAAPPDRDLGAGVIVEQDSRPTPTGKPTTAPSTSPSVAKATQSPASSSAQAPEKTRGEAKSTTPAPAKPPAPTRRAVTPLPPAGHDDLDDDDDFDDDYDSDDLEDDDEDED
ncbi:hypothetical protein AUR04nite_29660 [Glutamicibacter uratoxydans]|uniref:Uncharacterized protein n=1 Tax=Glutamicibacter uratoxydans TaxID=43667 RepID=A0A4Y4DU77_GLUUR|nr:hypothetical protein [Glutamicibacter uratoxydans]GED07434.1 hypothetical protein AUR04nite_29660 [Glutamicibacter uratoxydans]